MFIRSLGKSTRTPFVGILNLYKNLVFSDSDKKISPRTSICCIVEHSADKKVGKIIFQHC